MPKRNPSWMQQREWAARSFTPRRRAFEVRPIELLRPNPSYWPYPLSIEQVFEAMAGIVRLACLPGYRSHLQWGSWGPLEQITGGGLSDDRTPTVKSLEHLRAMFHNLYLGRDNCEGTRRWRDDHGIRFEGPARIPVQTYREFVALGQIGFACENAVRTTVERLATGDAGAKMAVSLNGSHPGCRTLHGTHASFTRQGRFRFTLTFGNRHPSEQGSSWSDTVAVSRKGETFLDTLARARDVHDVLVHGKRPCAAPDGRFDEFFADQVLWPGWIEGQVAGTLDGTWTNDERRPDGRFPFARGVGDAAAAAAA